MNEFKNLDEGFNQFKRNALSDLTPPKILKAIEGGYYAGAQCALTLLAETLDIRPDLCSREVASIFNECQVFFIAEKARRDSEHAEKRGKKK